jgi:hypothetical protein
MRLLCDLTRQAQIAWTNFVVLLMRQANYMTDSDINEKVVVIRCSSKR